jgi:hypothetical protein
MALAIGMGKNRGSHLLRFICFASSAPAWKTLRHIDISETALIGNAPLGVLA